MAWSISSGVSSGVTNPLALPVLLMARENAVALLGNGLCAVLRV
jgi:hypothetical protein